MLCCDICGSWIDDAELGAAVFPYPAEGAAVEVLTVHKGACHDAAEERLSTPEASAPWLELKKFLWQLSHNAGFPADAVQQLATKEDTGDQLP